MKPATATVTALTPSQQATKDALCIAFNSNAVAPTGVPLAALAQVCPAVSL